MKTRHIIPTLFFLCLLIRANAQEIHPSYPNGFHLGLVQTISVAPAMSVVPDGLSLCTLQSRATMGEKIGIEFSYHFAKYFGVSAGLDYALRLQYCLRVFDVQGNLQLKSPFHLPTFSPYHDFQIPIRFEFHYPVSKSILVYGTMGVNLTGFIHAADKNDIFYRQDCNFNGQTLLLRMKEPAALNVDMLMSMGIYYRLPYNDLLRFGVSTNIAFRDKLHGYYQFQNEGNAGGTLSYRHNLIGLEFGYIHCFRTKEQRTAFTNTR